MHMSGSPEAQRCGYELRFGSPCEGCVYAFPCDAQGHVDLQSLGLRAFNDYLFARALVGLRFSKPSVWASEESRLDPEAAHHAYVESCHAELA